jgi:DNA polymerase-3 subunit beta
VGKRSGDGFIAHKAMLVSALSRALSERVTLMDFTIGRKGLLGYLKALAGSNIVKVVPANGSASGVQANGHKRLKINCGANTSYLEDLAWISTEGKRITPLTICEVRVSPNNSVKPNIGSLELAEALNRVLPFTAKDDTRAILQCVLFTAKEGKLTLVSADGFRLAVTSLDYDDGEGQALINNDDLKGIANALRRAKRARISFEGEDVTKPSSLIIDTELIRYKWVSNGGQYPDYEKLIPTEFNTYAHFDTVEATKAISSLKILADSKAYPIDLTIANGKIVMANPDDKGQAEVSADTEGEGFARVDGKYLADVLKACGGMVDFKLTSPISPMSFSLDGYQVVVMPMITDKANEWQKAQAKAQKAEPADEPQTESEKVESEPKPKKAKKPVTAK